MTDDADDTKRLSDREVELLYEARRLDGEPDAVLSMWDHLRDNPGERLSRGDLEDVLDGVDVGYAGGFDSLWTNFVKSNASQGREENTLTALPGVEARGSDYVYTEGEE